MAVKPGEHPQALQRRYRLYKDQHGRRWGANVDKRTDHPCEALSPSFAAPLIPPQQYLRVSADPDNVQALTIAYDEWVSDLKAALKEWTEHMMKVGHAVNADKFDPKEPGPSVLLIVGPKPYPVEPVLAARAGDEWVLGLSSDMPKWAVPFFVPKADDELAFMREGADDPPADPPNAPARGARRTPATAA